MSKDVENVKRLIAIAIDVVIVIVLKRYFVTKSHFIVNLTFSFDLSKAKIFVLFINCIYIVFVYKMINCYFMNRKKHSRKMLKTCSCILDIRIKKQQTDNFILRFHNYIRILFRIVTKKRFDKYYLNFFSLVLVIIILIAFINN